MYVYLPIAEVSANTLMLLGIGGGIGLLAGVFGVGGGFLMTPLLILVGIPPSVAVATGSTQICAASFSGVLAHWRRKTLDVKMGLVLLAGGLVGAALGVQIFSKLRELGQVELVVSLCYVFFLGGIGTLMLIESINTLIRERRGTRKQARRRHRWVHGLPFRMRFRASNLYISAIPPFAIGILVGALAAIMGVGGGFFMVPAMIYLLGMSTNVVVGTSLFQIMFVTGATTMMHAITNHTVDVLLAVILLITGVIGSQIGVRVAPRIPAEQLRLFLALMVVAVCLKLAYDVVAPPEERFVVLYGEGA